MPSVTIMFNREEINSINLTKEIYIIGRHEDCAIRIDNLGVSRNHARIIQKDNSYVVEDLGSSNGTFVNGAKVNTHCLKDDDKINIGKYEIKYLERERTGNTAVNVQKENSIIPDDNLNTMEMDSDDIQKKFAALAAKADKKNNPSVCNEEPQVKKMSTSDAELKAREAEIQLLKKEMEKNRTYLVLLGIIAVVSILAAIIFASK